MTLQLKMEFLALVIILSLVGSSHGQSALCFQTPDTGDCRAYLPSFYFNPRTGSCDCFVFGGCPPGGNIFNTREMCMETCNVIPSQQVMSSECRRILAGRKPVNQTGNNQEQSSGGSGSIAESQGEIDQQQSTNPNRFNETAIEKLENNFNQITTTTTRRPGTQLQQVPQGSRPDGDPPHRQVFQSVQPQPQQVFQPQQQFQPAPQQPFQPVPQQQFQPAPQQQFPPAPQQQFQPAPQQQFQPAPQQQFPPAPQQQFQPAPQQQFQPAPQQQFQPAPQQQFQPAPQQQFQPAPQQQFQPAPQQQFPPQSQQQQLQQQLQQQQQQQFLQQQQQQQRPIQPQPVFSTGTLTAAQLVQQRQVEQQKKMEHQLQQTILSQQARDQQHQLLQQEQLLQHQQVQRDQQQQQLVRSPGFRPGGSAQG